MRNLTTLLLILAIALVQCKKQEEAKKVLTLPSATQVGAGTFGCLINGKLFLPGESPGFFISPREYLHLEYNPKGLGGGVTLSLYAIDYVNDPIRSFDFFLNEVLQEGKTYSLQNSGSFYPVQYSEKYDTYKVDTPLTGQLTITKIDLTKHILSGTFYFDAVGPGGKKVSITDGRFDVKY